MCDNNTLLSIDRLGQRKVGKYWAKKNRRFESLCRKIEDRNIKKQSFFDDLWNFLNDFIDQRPVDPRAAFVSEGLELCWANNTPGECPACCVMLGRYTCDVEYGVVPVIVSANIQCETCEKAADRGFLSSSPQIQELIYHFVDFSNAP